MKIEFDDPAALWTTSNSHIGVAVRVASVGGADASERELYMAFNSRHLWDEKRDEVMDISAKIQRVE